jgi:DNA-binding IclR family transcriptional regulator
MDNATPSDKNEMKSLRKAIGVLRAVSDSGRSLTVAELAATAGISRPAAYRIVQTMVAEGLLEHEPHHGGIALGYDLLPLAANLLDRNNLRLEALPYLDTLAQNADARANLGVMHRNRILYLAGAEKPSLPAIYSRFGKSVPVHCSSLGKAILSRLPEAQIREIVASEPMVRRTANTIVDIDALLADLVVTRQRGYAIDNAESADDVWCIAAVITGANKQPVGAIGISGRDFKAIEAHSGAVCQTAEVLSHMVTR